MRVFQVNKVPFRKSSKSETGRDYHHRYWWNFTELPMTKEEAMEELRADVREIFAKICRTTSENKIVIEPSFNVELEEFHTNNYKKL